MENVHPDIYRSMDRETRRHHDSLVFPEPRYAFLIVTGNEARQKDLVSGLQRITGKDVYTEGKTVFFTGEEDEK